MQFGLFGSATAARHADPDVDSGQGYRQFVDYNIEAEALGYKSTFLVEHHFTGFGQVSVAANWIVSALSAAFEIEYTGPAPPIDESCAIPVDTFTTRP
jgi:hypothetical protein